MYLILQTQRARKWSVRDPPLGFRIGLILFSDILWNITDKISELRCRFTVGSRAEGTENAGSDLDRLFIWEGVAIYERIQDVENKKDALFSIERASCLPGYTKLKLEHARNDDFIFDLVEEKCMQHYLSATKVLNYFAKYLRKQKGAIDIDINGPAVTLENTSSEANIDHSQGFEVCNIPIEGRDFLDIMEKSKMNRHWPSPETIDKLKLLKCHVVATGGPYKNDPDYSLKWRISYTLWERELVWSFANGQTMCYLYLKELKQSRLKEICNDITSFHLKNVVFWESVECPRDLLYAPSYSATQLELIRRCVARLHTAIQEKNLFHFIDRKRNLFEGKLENEEACQKLLDLLENSNERVASDIKLIKQVCLNRSYPDVFLKLKGRDEFLRSKLRWGHNVLHIKFEVFLRVRNRQYDQFVEFIKSFEKRPCRSGKLICNISAFIKEENQNMCHKMTQALQDLDADSQTKEIIQRCICFRLGLFVATFRVHWDKECTMERKLDTKQITDEYVLSLLTKHTDALSGLLYLCTYFLRDHRVSRAESEIDDFLRSGPMLLLFCGYSSNFTGINVEMGHATHTYCKDSLLSLPDQKYHYVHDVLVSDRDINFFPSGVAIQLLNENILFINPLVYLYYLKVFCDVSSKRNANKSLQRLSETVTNFVNDQNTGVHLNLLGHAYFLAKRYEEAYRCYCVSVFNQKRKYSVFIQLLILLCQMFKEM